MHDDGIDEQLIRRDSDHTSGAAVSMLRTTRQHHVELSAMADAKANLLITATSILLSVSIATSGGPLGARPGVARLAGLAVLSLVFAIFAVLPRYRHESSAPDRRASSFDPLFFGHLSSMSVDEYVEEIRRVAGDHDEIMAATARDIHGIGSHLQRHEYRYLRLAYLCFLAGLVSGGAVELAGLIL